MQQPDFERRVFNAFVQGKQQLDRSQGGLGLGLAIVRSLVELHGGAIGVHSAGIGEGAEFTVRLPGTRQRVQPSTPSWDQLLTQGNRKARILVVDDNHDAAATLGRCLIEIGFTVDVAGNSRSALELASRNVPDAAVLDIGLPDMDGYQLAAELRRTAKTKNMPIIALSGYGQDRDRASSQLAGINCHLIKPAEPAMLALLLDRYLSRTQS